MIVVLILLSVVALAVAIYYTNMDKYLIDKLKLKKREGYGV